MEFHTKGSLFAEARAISESDMLGARTLPSLDKETVLLAVARGAK
jgi:hypothetical protein